VRQSGDGVIGVHEGADGGGYNDIGRGDIFRV